MTKIELRIEISYLQCHNSNFKWNMIEIFSNKMDFANYNLKF